VPLVEESLLDDRPSFRWSRRASWMTDRRSDGRGGPPGGPSRDPVTVPGGSVRGRLPGPTPFGVAPSEREWGGDLPVAGVRRRHGGPRTDRARAEPARPAVLAVALHRHEPVGSDAW